MTVVDGPHPEILVHPDASAVAHDAAGRLIATLAAARSARGVASLVLTGGGIGTATMRAVAEHPDRDRVDWSAVEVFWGDERFVPAGTEERNDRVAREVLLDRLPFDPARIHPMPAADGEQGDDPGAAAEVYAQVLADAAGRLGGEGGLPAFDLLLAGCGPEGHTLSVFPDSPAARAEGAGVVPVHDCPKPPPTRVSLTLAASRHARESWLLATGEGKAEVVARAAAGAPELEVPLGGLRGTERTLWWLDRAAASRL